MSTCKYLNIYPCLGVPGAGLPAPALHRAPGHQAGEPRPHPGELWLAERGHVTPISSLIGPHLLTQPGGRRLKIVDLGSAVVLGPGTSVR